jgi:hypothetical protein
MNISFESKNFLSEYELKHIVWVGIEYDKEKLISFFDRYQQLKLIPKTHDSIEELRIMESILNSHNNENLQKLLKNDFEYSRWSIIEKYSRRATVEILLDGKYSKETFSTISCLPTVDFKLIMKRTKELIKTINETITESEMDTSKISGVK